MKKTCEVCLTAETPLTCEKCKKPSCKNCSVFMDEDCFEIFELLPEHLKHKTYCPQCYNESIADDLAKYEEILERAKNINTYDISQSSETRLMKRTEKPIQVSNCHDTKEALMHLALKAAEKGFNTLLDVNIKSEKSNEKSYKKKTYSGTAVPINLDVSK